VSDRDGDYAWDMQNARGNFASDMQRSHHDSSINPLGTYQGAAGSALDRWATSDDSPRPRGAHAVSSSTYPGGEWELEGGHYPPSGSSAAMTAANAQYKQRKLARKNPSNVLRHSLLTAALSLLGAIFMQFSVGTVGWAFPLIIVLSLAKAGYSAWKLYGL